VAVRFCLTKRNGATRPTPGSTNYNSTSVHPPYREDGVAAPHDVRCAP
jgi:hypothetical protein